MPESSDVSSSSYKGLNLIILKPDPYDLSCPLLPLHRPCLQIHPHWELQLYHVNFGGIRIQSITDPYSIQLTDNDGKGYIVKKDSSSWKLVIEI